MRPKTEKCTFHLNLVFCKKVHHDTNRYLVQGPITLTITNLGGLDCNQQDLRLQPTTNGPLIDDHRLEDKTTNDNQLWSIIETNDP